MNGHIRQMNKHVIQLINIGVVFDGAEPTEAVFVPALTGREKSYWNRMKRKAKVTGSDGVARSGTSLVISQIE